MRLRFAPKNLITRQYFLKLPELLLTALVMLMTRFGLTDLNINLGHDIIPLPFGRPTDTDAHIAGFMMAFGFFTTVLVQVVALLLDEKAPLQNMIFGILSFVFYVTLGAVQVDYYRTLETRNVSVMEDTRTRALFHGSISIVTGVVFWVDTFIANRDFFTAHWDRRHVDGSHHRHHAHHHHDQP